MRKTASEIGKELHEIDKGLSGVEEAISQLYLDNPLTRIQAPLLPELLESYDNLVGFLLADMDIVQSDVTDLLEYHQGRVKAISASLAPIQEALNKQKTAQEAKVLAAAWAKGAEDEGRRSG